MSALTAAVTAIDDLRSQLAGAKTDKEVMTIAVSMEGVEALVLTDIAVSLRILAGRDL